jgi:hypothetical protein
MPERKLEGSPDCGLAVESRGGNHRTRRRRLPRFVDAGSAGPSLPAIGNVSLTAGLIEVEMNTRISRWTLLTILALAMMAPRFAVAQAQSEAPGEIYPGRFVAKCKPAGNSGCACDADPQNIHNPEHLRMTEWLLQTCSWLIQSDTRLRDKATTDVATSVGPAGPFTSRRRHHIGLGGLSRGSWSR